MSACKNISSLNQLQKCMCRFAFFKRASNILPTLIFRIQFTVPRFSSIKEALIQSKKKVLPLMEVKRGNHDLKKKTFEKVIKLWHRIDKAYKENKTVYVAFF